MRWESAAFISSSRKSGCDTLMSFSARSHVDAPARFTTPVSYTHLSSASRREAAYSASSLLFSSQSSRSSAS